MKTKHLVFILFVQIFFTSLNAQNHHHFSPYRSKSERIIRMDSSIYKEFTTVEVTGLSTSTQVEAKKMYTIPVHLRKLDTEIIDSIVRKNKSFTTIEWSWFIIWDRTYTRDVVYNQFSWFAVKNLLIANGAMALFFVGLVFLRKKSVKEGIKELSEVDFLKELTDGEVISILLGYSLLICIIAFAITDLQKINTNFCVFLGFVIYNVVILFVFFLPQIVRKKILLQKK